MELQVLGACLLLVLLNLAPGTRSATCVVTTDYKHLVDTIKKGISKAEDPVCGSSTSNCGIEHTKSATGMLKVKFICGACPDPFSSTTFECKSCPTGSTSAGQATHADGICNKYEVTKDVYIANKLLKERTICNYHSGDFPATAITFTDAMRVYCGVKEKCASSVWWEGNKKMAFIGCNADCESAVKGKEMNIGKNAVCTNCTEATSANCKITPHRDVADKAWTAAATTKAQPTTGMSTTKLPNKNDGGGTTAGATAVSPSNLALTAAVTGALLVLAGSR